MCLKMNAISCIDLRFFLLVAAAQVIAASVRLTSPLRRMRRRGFEGRLILVVLCREEVGPFRAFGFVTGQLDTQRVLRLFCRGTEGLGKEVSVDSDFVICRERFVFATAEFTTEPCVGYRERLSII